MKDGRNGRPRDRPEEKLSIYDEWGAFSIVPNEFIDACREIPEKAFILFVIIKRYSNNDTGYAYPSYTEIHRITGWSRTTIALAIKGLEKAGWLVVETRPQQNNKYRLVRRKQGSPETGLPALPSDDQGGGSPETGLGSPETGLGVVLKLDSIKNKEDLDTRLRSTSLRSVGDQASLIAPLDAPGSSFQEDASASDNALVSLEPVSACGPVTESEDLEARVQAEYRSIGKTVAPPGTGILNLLIRPMSATEFSEGYTDSEIGTSQSAEAPPLVAGAPPPPKTSPRRRQTAKKAIGETAEGQVEKAKPTRPRIVVDGITCDHPAVRAVKDLLKRTPNHEAWPRIVAVLGESWDQDKLVTTYREWVSRGFNPFNLAGWLFRWYPEGIPDLDGRRSVANVYGSREPEIRPRSKQTIFCGRNGCDRGWIRGNGGLRPCQCNEQERPMRR